MAHRSKSRLILGILLALALGVAVYFAYGMIWYQREEVQKRLAECQARSELANQSSLALLERYLSLLKGLSRFAPVRAHDRAASEDLFRRLAADFPGTVNIASTGQDGCFFASAIPLSDPSPCVAQTDYFQRLLRGAPFALMQPHVGPVSDLMVIGIVVPIRGEDGTFQGLVGASLRFASLAERLQALDRQDGLSLAVYGRAGIVRYASGELGRFAEEKLDEKAAFLRDIKDVNGIPTIVHNGREYVAGVAVSAQSGLTFVTIAPKDVALGGFFRTRPQAYWILSCIALLLGTGSYLQWKDRRWLRALAASENRFRMILEHSPVGIIVYDSRSGNCVAANKAVADLVGGTVEQILKQNFNDIESWRHTGLDLLARKVLAGEGPQRTDFRQTSSFGKEVMLDCLLARIGSEAEEYLLLIASDIAEKTRMQQIMIQTEKMMNLGGLAAGMAHEINNPLSGIVQNAQVLVRRLKEDNPGNRRAAEEAGCGLERIRRFMELREAYQLLDGLRDSAVRASATVKGMLEFARKTGGERKPADVHQMLDKALQLSLNDYDLKKRYDFRKVTVEKQYARDLPPVPCMANQVEQVLLNLLRNAAQAMACCRKGAPAPKLVLRTSLEGGYVRIDVEDNGPGMTEEVRARVFEPFFSTKGPEEGTGLGLSVSSFIITGNHKGLFDVESTPGKGTTFIIRLPLEPPSA